MRSSVHACRWLYFGLIIHGELKDRYREMDEEIREIFLSSNNLAVVAGVVQR